jgi:Lon protease-like protein
MSRHRPEPDANIPPAPRHIPPPKPEKPASQKTEKKVALQAMTNFIPVFPLGIVVYPGEHVNLHIFESRYKQLVGECHKEGKPFGIPTVIDNKLNEMGTLVKITELVKVYDNGEMDVRTEGLRVFRVLELIKSVPDKLFSGAIVNYPENIEGPGKQELMQKVIIAVRELHRLLEISKDFHKPDEELSSYDIAHHAGLSIEEEYELLGLLREEQRQEYLRLHLAKVLPVIAEMGTLKEKVKLNGHFKNLSSFKFED